ncbi:unnamed protein product [Lymnaea stagnalis]|uniref:PBZ-type domain-containing protein n=1 Tax=Lymnaea stagnalis TaxID=6523 RepID=A0AAV2I8B1_LYMST
MAAIAKNKKPSKKPACKYGSKCYRKNPQHIQNYSHLDEDENNDMNEIEGKARPVKTSRETKQKRTINDFFSKSKQSHEVSDSDEDTGPPPGKKGKSEHLSKTNISEDEPDTGDGEGEKSSLDTEEDETEVAPNSPEDVKQSIKDKYLVEMPADFYQFWDFCKSLKPGNPSSALEKTLNVSLVGPFDILGKKHKLITKNKHGRRPNFLLHYRYYYDPPEFQTVLISKDDSSKFHLGYYRDDPKEAPVFVASSSPGESPKEKIYQCGENLFAALHDLACRKLKSSSGETKQNLEQLIKSVKEAAEKYDLPLAMSTRRIKDRQKKVVSPTFHGAGIVVPVDANDVGYRPVPETPAALRGMLKKIADSKTDAERDKSLDPLQELITLVQFANDECDYGEGLELGLDLFSYGSSVLHPQISSLLPLAYQLLNRQEFSRIIEAHLKRRRGLTECVDELAV